MALLIASVIAPVLFVAAVTVQRVAARRVRDRYEAEKADLLARGRNTTMPAAAGPDIELPTPVRKYVDVTRDFQRPLLKLATLKQRGALRAAAGKPWMPFEAEQAYSMQPPGFVWLAKARAAPLVSILARDKFVDGKGHMLVSLLGLFTLADARGPEIDLGAGLRFWGEILSFPEMIRSPHLRWEAIDERQARLEIQHEGLTLTATVTFSEEGLPIGIQAQRYRDVDGTPVLTPWSGHSRSWKRIRGRLFPTEWESIWHLPEGDLSAVRIEVLDLQVE
jgi:hypothetical protein